MARPRRVLKDNSNDATMARKPAKPAPKKKKKTLTAAQKARKRMVASARRQRNASKTEGTLPAAAVLRAARISLQKHYDAYCKANRLNAGQGKAGENKKVRITEEAARAIVTWATEDVKKLFATAGQTMRMITPKKATLTDPVIRVAAMCKSG